MPLYPTRRSRLAVAALCLALPVALLTPLAASAAPVEVPAAASGMSAPLPAPAPTPVMGEYPLESYAAAAAELDPALAAAVEADLGVSPEQYLADADAAADAAAVVDALTASGTEVLRSRLEGTTLIVTVDPADEAARAAVEGANAVAEAADPATPSGSDRAPEAVDTDDARLLADLVGGQGYASYKPATGGDDAYMCSVGFNGAQTGTGTARFLTAGHCKVDGTRFSGRVFQMTQNVPGEAAFTDTRLGDPVASTFSLGNELDSGVMTTTTPAFTPTARVGTWNGNAGPVTAGTQQVVRDYSRATEGQSICKSGRTSGWTCGTVREVDKLVTIVDGGQEVVVNSYITSMCALGGDSGGAVVSGAVAVGIISNGTFDACGQSGKFTGVFPMTAQSDYGSVLGSQPDWELKVDVATPVVTFPVATTAVNGPLVMTGTLPGGGVHHTVGVSLDGGPAVTVAVATNGTWAVDLGTVSAAPHRYTVTAQFGSGLSSASISSVFNVPVERIQGPDRYAVALAVAEKAFPGDATAPVVYLATGLNYPDALSAGPAAVRQGGPLLLTLPDRVPDEVLAKIVKLKPDRVVIVGGTASVGTSVATALAGALPDTTKVERLAGADRYAASRAVVSSAFPAGSVTRAYTATGANFPDALSAGAAAGSAEQPVLLVYGKATSVDAVTLDVFRSVVRPDAGDPRRVTIVGGANSVSAAIETSLRTGVPATVDRVVGADRFQTSINLNRAAFASVDTVYIATGLNFPDALAGSVLAGRTDSPLYVVPTDCVPRGVIADLGTLGASRVVLLGGAASLNAAVATLTPCAW